MISEFPLKKIPGPISRICKLDLSASKVSHLSFTDIIQEDPFLSLYIQETFKEYIKKGGLTGLVSAFGQQGLRNRIAEVYLYHARNGRYPRIIEQEEVIDVIDFEKRFDFLYSDVNGRAFLLGFYLKLCAIEYEDNNQYQELDQIVIPPDVDEILITGKSKSALPDWLIIAVWSLSEICGHERAYKIFERSKGNMDIILSEINEEEYERFIASLLRYGIIVDEADFFTEVKV